ncbi:MAG: prepilin-type N-terminal cleavage/methylation domain-containing protein [Halieaceae bacterium]
MIRQRHSGFTLLEAIVAMTVFATSALGLYSWINSMMIGTARFDAIAIESTDVDNALSYLEVLNPMETPSGSKQLGAAILSWQSELVEPVRPGNMVRSNEFGLYELTVKLERDGTPDQTFKLRQVGYRKLQVTDATIGI